MSKSARIRLVSAIVALTFMSGSGQVLVAKADPTPTPEVGSPLVSEAEAMRRAQATDLPVVASALTDERTLVTAQPEGHFEAVLSAGVARVRDGRGGWRDPSAKLVRAGDVWRTEAALAEVTVSAGGSTDLVVVADGGSSVSLGWPSALPEAVVDGATATYPEVYQGVDLVVRATVTSAETFLVVKTPAAAANPSVRTAAFTFASSGLTIRPLGNGARSLVDGQGVERLVIPPARMWDSSGKERGVTRPSDVVAEAAEARTAPVDVKVEPGRLTAVADGSLLDDPDAVFPVIIDPEVSLAQSYVVRVTEDFDQINNMSVDGKVGYNGWNSPYYKSRMFYQFKWPTSSGDQQILTGSQIIDAEFQYLQRHSPQYDCGASYGPGVRVRLYNSIGSDTTWPGPSAHSWDPKTTSLAVGSESHGCAAKWQTWSIASMLKSERSHSSYKSRTTVTVGIYSADESKKEGWRHYDNNPGPKLLIAYNPVALGTELAIAGSVAGPPWVTTSAAPTLTPKVKLATSGLTCDGSTCLKGRATITGPGQSGTAGSWVSTSASSVTVPITVSGLQDGKSYTVKIEGEETRSGRTVSKTFSFWSDQNPGTTPSEVAFAPYAGGGWQNSGTSDTLTPLLRARVGLPTGATCLELTACLAATFTVFDQGTNDVVWQGTAPAVAAGTTAQVQVPTSAALVEGRSYRVEVASTKTTNLLTSPGTAITFTAGLRPEETVVIAPPATEGLPVSVTFTNANPVAKFEWEAVCSNAASSSGEVTTSTANITVAGCAGSLLIRARGVSAFGLVGPWSPQSTIAIGD
ncbi:hypothetical protein [Micropruina sp.]|uniref:hypothetical protein n=1 Tax=Micropruina sp. TaxID=2737536 RepID=UPI0039E2829C